MNSITRSVIAKTTQKVAKLSQISYNSDVPHGAMFSAVECCCSFLCGVYIYDIAMLCPLPERDCLVRLLFMGVCACQATTSGAQFLSLSDADQCSHILCRCINTYDVCVLYVL